MQNDTTTGILALDRETVHLIQDLIKASLDASALLAEASRKVSHAGLAGLFQRLGRERAWMARDLQVLVEAGDERPARRGTAAGAVRRLWIDLRSAINAGDPRVLMAEIEPVEARTLAVCRAAMERTASGPVHDWLAGQHARLQRDRLHLRRRREN
jgi:uncharacterized protein (TIGR02284 family)